MAILRLRSLGDCVLTTPAVDILKRCRPDLRLAVVVEDRFRDIFEGNPDVDEILAPEGGAARLPAEGVPESARRNAERLAHAASGARIGPDSDTSATGGFITFEFPGRRRFSARSGRSIRRNIWLARCFIWGRPRWRFRGRNW